MNLLIAPDSFKGCLTSLEVCAAISEGILAADPNINVLQFPSSDGGEGFCDSMRNIYGGTVIEREVTYPLGNKGTASYVYNFDSSTAFIELASASGLALVPKGKRDILNSSTYGVGELIADALLRGASSITVGLGGSATNDCGIGLLSALGMRFYDEYGKLLKPVAASLGKVVYADKSEMPDLSTVRFTAACDVRNPLCGINGAAEVYSRQKGADEETVACLDESALSFAKALGIVADLPGSGAAGGVGAALISVLGAEYVSGAALLVSSEAFTCALKNADLLITGEGNTDYQTACGKLISVLAEAADKFGVPAIVLSGGLSKGYEALYDLGVIKCYALSSDESDRDYCIKNASKLLKQKATEIILDFKSKTKSPAD